MKGYVGTKVDDSREDQGAPKTPHSRSSQPQESRTPSPSVHPVDLYLQLYLLWSFSLCAVKGDALLIVMVLPWRRARTIHFLRRAPERPHPTCAAFTIEPREQGERRVSRG